MNRLVWLGIVAAASIACAPVPAQQQARRPSLTAEEAAEFQRRDGALCQAAIGIRIDDPGAAFESAPALSQSGGNVRMWGWERRETGERLLLTAVKSMGETPAGFQDFADGARKGMEGKGEVDEASLDTNVRPYVSTLNVRLANGNAYSTRCIGTAEALPLPWTICATTVSLQHGTFKSLRDSLRVQSCVPAGV